MTAMFMAAAEEETKKEKQIYVAPPTIHDQVLYDFQPYLTSLLVASAQANTHWVKRSKRADTVIIHDKHTIEIAQDTTCNYFKPLKCSVENMHWAMITDIFVTKNFATIVVKLYDEEAKLIASASKSSYSVEQCKSQTKKTTVTPLGRPPTEIIEENPPKCTVLNPKILASDIKQAVTILFASIHPI